MFEPLLRRPLGRVGPRRASSGWLLASVSAVAGAGVSVVAILAVPPAGSRWSLLFTITLTLAAGIAGGQRIKLDERTLQPAPTLLFVVAAAIVLGPAAAIVVGAAAALGTSRTPIQSLVCHIALAAMTGASTGLVAHAVAAAVPGMNVMLITGLAAASGAATWTAGEFVIRVARGIGHSLRAWTVTAEAVELLVAVAFSPAMVALFRSAGVGAATVLAAALVSMFVAFRIYRDRLLRLHAEITQLSRTDPLTGVGNRRIFDEQLESEVGRAARTGQPMGLLLIDIDHFKELNDGHGHETGDRVLRELCRHLTARLRHEDLLARLGGDEFGAIITGVADQSNLGQVADTLCQSVRESAILGRDEALNVTVCIGGATSDSWLNSDALRRAADAALYAAKARGRDCAVVSHRDDHDATPNVAPLADEGELSPKPSSA